MSENIYYFYRPRDRDLYKTWLSYDLAEYRPFYYKNLAKSDEPVVWDFIETYYLDRYKALIGLRFEWSYSEGLWNIRFPGSVGYGNTIVPDKLGISQDTQEIIYEWHTPLNSRKLWADDYDDSKFDYINSDQLGLKAAKQVKIELGDDYYVEYNPFQEIVIQNGIAVELPIPELITRLGMKQS